MLLYPISRNSVSFNTSVYGLVEVTAEGTEVGEKEGVYLLQKYGHMVSRVNFKDPEGMKALKKKGLNLNAKKDESGN